MKRFLKISNYALLVLFIGAVYTSCEKEPTTEFEPEQETDLLEESVNARINSTTRIVALQNVDSGRYVSSENGGNVTCNRTKIGAWETITMTYWADGTVSFRGNNGKYLSDNDGQGRIKFNRTAAGEWEKFDLKIDPATGAYSIIRAGKTPRDGYYYLYGRNMTFGLDYVREDALFKIIILGSSKTVALKNVDSGLFVSSENGKNVTCNRKEVGPWEKITLVEWADGTVSFKGSNGKYLSDNNGQGRIKFDRTEAGEWEKFDVEGNPSGGFSVIRAGKTPRDGYYYLYGRNMTFGIEYIREDALFELVSVQ